MNHHANRVQMLYVDGVPTHAVLSLADYETLMGAHDDPLIRHALDMISNVRTPRQARQREWPVAHIAQARAARGLSQRQLGDKLGLQQSQVSRIERNPAQCTAETLTKIAKTLGVKLVIE